ncbi:putative urate catabolism protein [Variovorax sp. SRS16]|uniref:polysaccharide deacetylase family protein n=1 Tax=Variovorax sp. SRS16 TaxID=282217 RepID=UPI001318BC70|nr:polysaccharide deacetylase family protein [Variovorax sp. SRS16]VTU25154.1 putative urate catabolism protein [Variovorax sp. SRS16]
MAVSFVVNFEEGAEFSLGDGDGRNEAVYEVIDQQGVHDPCIETHFEYGTRVGYWRIAELFDRYEGKFTLSSCGKAVEVSPWLARDALARGHEVSAHGYRWESHAGMSEATERDCIQRTLDAIERVTGERPVGWHTRSVRTANTRKLLVEQGMLYDSDAYNDDTPYFVDVGGRSHLVLPYAFDTNDMQFQHTQRFDTANSFVEYVCDAFDWLWEEGERVPRMLSVGLHLRMIGRPGRIVALQRILDHMRRRGGAWITTRREIAKHWTRLSA